MSSLVVVLGWVPLSVATQLRVKYGCRGWEYETHTASAEITKSLAKFGLVLEYT